MLFVFICFHWPSETIRVKVLRLFRVTRPVSLLFGVCQSLDSSFFLGLPVDHGTRTVAHPVRVGLQRTSSFRFIIILLVTLRVPSQDTIIPPSSPQSITPFVHPYHIFVLPDANSFAFIFPRFCITFSLFSLGGGLIFFSQTSVFGRTGSGYA